MRRFSLVLLVVAMACCGDQRKERSETIVINRCGQSHGHWLAHTNRGPFEWRRAFQGRLNPPSAPIFGEWDRRQMGDASGASQ